MQRVLLLRVLLVLFDSDRIGLSSDGTSVFAIVHTCLKLPIDCKNISRGLLPVAVRLRVHSLHGRLSPHLIRHLLKVASLPGLELLRQFFVVGGLGVFCRDARESW